MQTFRIYSCFFR